MILNIFNKKFVTIITVFSTLLVVIFNNTLLIGIITLLFLIALQGISKKNIIFLVIISLLVVSSDINETLRIVTYLFGISFLLFSFFQDYGLNITKYPKISKNLYFYWFFVIASMILSSIFSQNILIGLSETLRQLLFLIIIYALFSNLDEEKDIYAYIGALITSGIIIALSIAYNFITSDISVYILQSQGLIHEGGSFKNVAASGGILAVTIPLTTIIILLINNKKNVVTYLLYFFLILQLLSLLLTNSRVAVIAVVISSSIIFFVLRRKIFYKFVISLSVILLATFIFIPQFSETIEIYFRLDRVLENTRYILWDMSVAIIEDNPIWGTGPGQFKNYMYTHLPVMLNSWEELQISWIHEFAGLGESHNFFLFRTAETGLFGFLSAVFLPILFIYLSKKVMLKYKNEKNIYYITVGIFAIGIGMFIRSLFESTGILSNGWITRDLPFWVCFIIIIFFDSVRSNGKQLK